jgi:integrase
MPQKVATTHTVIEQQLVVYRRASSGVWQCRYKCDGSWQRATTKHVDLKKAQDTAQRLLIEAEVRKAQNLPMVTRRFRDIAKLAVVRMQDEIKVANGKKVRGHVSYKDYIRVIHDYLMPILGNRAVTNIDAAALAHLDAERAKMMGRVPAKSTLMTHNAALNRVFEEAQIRGFLTEINRPKITSKGGGIECRPAFTIPEIQTLIKSFDGWIDKARSRKSREAREIMRDYALVLLDTGARPGVELTELRWNQIAESDDDPIIYYTYQTDEYGQKEKQVNRVDLRRSVRMTVTGKTGTRTILGMDETVRALARIAKRNYPDVEQSTKKPLENIAIGSNNDYVFRRADKSNPCESFQKMFEKYLRGLNLLIDPVSRNKRVFYSLRHSYATFALEHDKVPIHTLAKQMGTSVLMIERHYSHLSVVVAIDQLRGEESRGLISGGGIVNEIEKKKKLFVYEGSNGEDDEDDAQ